jgi:hypothetical protein
MPSPTEMVLPILQRPSEPFQPRPLSTTPMFGAWGYFMIFSLADSSLLSSPGVAVLV